MSELRTRPTTLDEACAFVNDHHRHHKASRLHRFSVGLADSTGKLVGVGIAGNPKARHLADGTTIEVVRLATDGTRNACSKIYAELWKAAKALGYRRAVTYTQVGESGDSLRGAGWRKIAILSPRAGWDTPSRPRIATGTEGVARIRWEITTHDAPPITLADDETRYETPHCAECLCPIEVASTGRPPRYCGTHCRQRAFRRRKRAQPPTTA
jgi:hypothetical protein